MRRHNNFIEIKYLLKGTDEERGIRAWSDQMKLNHETDGQSSDGKPNSTYDFPVGMSFVRK